MNLLHSWVTNRYFCLALEAVLSLLIVALALAVPSIGSRQLTSAERLLKEAAEARDFRNNVTGTGSPSSSPALDARSRTVDPRRIQLPVLLATALGPVRKFILAHPWLRF